MLERLGRNLMKCNNSSDDVMDLVRMLHHHFERVRLLLAEWRGVSVACTHNAHDAAYDIYDARDLSARTTTSRRVLVDFVVHPGI